MILSINEAMQLESIKEVKEQIKLRQNFLGEMQDRKFPQSLINEIFFLNDRVRQLKRLK